ncbi:MAG: heme utilization cystosolic carrier protein HutX [Beijerinckiaceae bacterium]|nr:heme utilization cystosolic carrier protein HutX [Beijerinckiaceae bacterium]MCZ8299023.1 heme utilization cystosolic carrier protein HutX [Beijerinckiaceae bacterium]
MALLRDIIARKPDGVVEAMAREAGVPTQVALEAMPEEQRLFAPSDEFEAIWREVGNWGEILFIVHTADIVLECEGSLPAGTFGQGYYNIHGDSPIGGHIRAANCRAIYLVDRAFHGRRSCSIQFFNGEGEAMFKIFVRRDEERNLLPDQLARFEGLKARLAAL